jgi:hypothetical protein
LLVEIATTLAAEPAAVWQTGSVWDIGRQPGAAAALQEAHRKGWRIIYLAVVVDDPKLYRKGRDWVNLRLPGTEPRFPQGPVLGRLSYGEAEAVAVARAALLRDLRQRFHGEMQALTSQSEEASAYQKAGLKTWLIGAEGPVDVLTVPSWEELAQRLGPAAKG